MPNRRTFVLDTSVLLSSPNAYLAFQEHEVVIPLVVISELEGKRHDPELGYLARAAIRGLESLRLQGTESLRAGIQVNERGGTVRVEINHTDQQGLPDALRVSRAHDTRILAVAHNLASEGKDVTVVSKDMPMRLLADVVGLRAEEFRSEQLVVDDRYTGMVTHHVAKEALDSFYETGTLSLRELAVPVNTGVVLAVGRTKALGRVTKVTASGEAEIAMVPHSIKAFSMEGRSAEQKVALAHLLDESVGIVSLGGAAGTGKSLLALAAALEAVVERRSMERVVVFRPLFAVGGQDLGYLPGTEADKMSPWGAAVFDALRAITTDDVIDEVIGRGVLEVLPLTHIRGRTLGPRTVVIIDEAQNLEKPILLTALSRLGEGSRAFLTHDVAQRDNLRVGRHDGVAAVVERLKGDPLFAHVTLTKSERSPIAALVTALLDDA